jgi:hypothetical protein
VTRLVRELVDARHVVVEEDVREKMSRTREVND